MELTEFPQLFQKEYKRLVLIASAIAGSSHAEDVVQDAAIVAYKKFGAFEQGSNFGAWMATIVRNCAANERRKSNRTMLSEPKWFDLQKKSEENPNRGYEIEDLQNEGFAEQLQLDDNVLRGLKQLSGEARCCLLLRVIEKMSYGEIAVFLEIPQGTAMSHVHRSKKMLREFLRGKTVGGRTDD